jgi:hypothetical protein
MLDTGCSILDTGYSILALPAVAYAQDGYLIIDTEIEKAIKKHE